MKTKSNIEALVPSLTHYIFMKSLTLRIDKYKLDNRLKVVIIIEGE